MLELVLVTVVVFKLSGVLVVDDQVPKERERASPTTTVHATETLGMWPNLFWAGGATILRVLARSTHK